MSDQFDVAVIGLGGAGLAACKTLAEAGYTVLGLEQFEFGHSHGSSHADTRLFRTAYYEGDAYVPILQKSRLNWLDWNQQYQDLFETDQLLFNQTGIFIFGDAESSIVNRSYSSGQKNQLPVELVEMSQFNSTSDHWQNSFSLPEGFVRFHEVQAGFLYAERTLKFLKAKAEKVGAVLKYQSKLKGYQKIPDGFQMESEGLSAKVKKIILCPGAWLDHLGLVNSKIEVNVHCFWQLDNFAPTVPWGFETSEHFFYGFPSVDGKTTKINIHNTGLYIDSPEQASEVDLQPVLNKVEAFIREYLPSSNPRLLEHKSCLYTMTPDEHFYLDTPSQDLLVMGGLSGHGFKFLPALGQIAQNFMSVSDPLHQGLGTHFGNFFKLSRV